MRGSIGNDAEQLVGIVLRLLRRGERGLDLLAPVQPPDDLASDANGVGVVLGEVVAHAGEARVHFRAAQRLVVHLLARRHLHQRWPAEENLRLPLDQDGVVREAGDIGAASGGGAEDERDLRDARRRHARLVGERAPAEVGEELGLIEQIRARRLDEVDAGQAVARGDLLRSQRLLDRHRVARAAFGRRVVRADHALDAADHADAVDARRAGRLVVVHAPRRQRAQLQERRPGVQQQLDALAWEQLATLAKLALAAFAAALAHGLLPLRKLVEQRAHRRVVALIFFTCGVYEGRQNAHLSHRLPALIITHAAAS